MPLTFALMRKQKKNDDAVRIPIDEVFKRIDAKRKKK